MDLKEKIQCDVDDMLYDMKKNIQKKYNISWEEARDYANDAIASLCCDCWVEKGMYGVDK